MGNAVKGTNALKTFAQALCESAGCAPEDYVLVVLKHCLYQQYRQFAGLYAHWMSAADLQLLKDVGTATTEEQLHDPLLDSRQHLRRHGGFLAKRLKFRVSTGRLEKLFAQVMPEKPGPVGVWNGAALPSREPVFEVSPR